MTFAEKMKGLAKKAGKSLVLAEGLEKRTLKAARIIMDEKIASSVTLVGPVDKVRAAAEAEGVSLEGIKIEDPATDSKKAEFAKEYYELRKHKGMTEEQAADIEKAKASGWKIFTVSDEIDDTFKEV